MRIKGLSTASLCDPEEGLSFHQTSDQSLTLRWQDYTGTPAQVTFRGVDRFVYQVEPLQTVEDLAKHEGSFVEVIGSDYLREFVAANYQTGEPGLRLFYLSTNVGEWCEIIALGFDTA